ncbi:hypothetical protein HDU76_009208 [Blyttiomyces sp. JEL0837]|nr:hypothetical protein HDU76_009208 [Blyttiomyces sp. JEL0837]
MSVDKISDPVIVTPSSTINNPNPAQQHHRPSSEGRPESGPVRRDGGIQNEEGYNSQSKEGLSREGYSSQYLQQQPPLPPPQQPMREPYHHPIRFDQQREVQYPISVRIPESPNNNNIPNPKQQSEDNSLTKLTTTKPTDNKSPPGWRGDSNESINTTNNTNTGVGEYNFEGPAGEFDRLGGWSSNRWTQYPSFYYHHSQRQPPQQHHRKAGEMEAGRCGDDVGEAGGTGRPRALFGYDSQFGYYHSPYHMHARGAGTSSGGGGNIGGNWDPMLNRSTWHSESGSYYRNCRPGGWFGVGSSTGGPSDEMMRNDSRDSNGDSLSFGGRGKKRRRDSDDIVDGYKKGDGSRDKERRDRDDDGKEIRDGKGGSNRSNREVDPFDEFESELKWRRKVSGKMRKVRGIVKDVKALMANGRSGLPFIGVEGEVGSGDISEGKVGVDLKNIEGGGGMEMKLAIMSRKFKDLKSKDSVTDSSASGKKIVMGAKDDAGEEEQEGRHPLDLLHDKLYKEIADLDGVWTDWMANRDLEVLRRKRSSINPDSNFVLDDGGDDIKVLVSLNIINVEVWWRKR